MTLADDSLKVVHVITTLDVGGAQMALYKLLGALDRERFDSAVISLTDRGEMGDMIERIGVPVEAVGMRRGRPGPLGLVRLTRMLRRSPPDVVQTWMYHADLIGGLAARIAGAGSVVWGLRQSDLDPRSSKRTTIWAARASARLSSRVPDSIVCGSAAARAVHARLGYADDKMVVVTTGFDIDSFRPDPSARAGLREELGVGSEAPVIGLVARLDPQKDHRGFLRAAGRIRSRLPDARFVLCGEGLVPSSPELARWIGEEGLEERVHLLGLRHDMPRVTAALDVACSGSAYGEGLPNAVGEAMAAAVPCVVTDVGDSAWLVGDTGRVVPPRDPEAFADAVIDLLAQPQGRRDSLGAAARVRIEQHASIPAMAEGFAAVYDRLASAPG